MADKVQTVRIQFVTDTAGLTQAENLSKRADAATAKLNQTIQQGAKGNASNINNLTAEQQRLENAIKSTQRTSFTSYSAFAKQIQNLSRQYSDVKVKIDAATKSMNEQAKAQQNIAKNTQSLTQQFSGLYSTIRGVFAGVLIKEVIQTSLEMAKLAGNVDGVSKAFARLPNSVVLLSDLRAATHGTVGDLELMQKALQANNFRIPLENLGTLFEFAATKAQQTGQEVNHLVDYIVSGIGYRSIKRLDDLGFTANRVKEALGGVSLQAATMQQVMTAVTTLMNEDLGKTGGYAETAATKVGQLETKWQELKVTVSQRFTQDGGFIDYLNEVLEKTREILDPGIRRQDAVTAGAVDMVKEFQKTLGPDAQKNIEDTQQKLNSLVQVVGHYNDAINKSAESYKELNIGAGEMLPSLEKLAKIYGRENEAGEIGLVLSSRQIALRKELNEVRLQDLKNTELQIKNLVRERDTFAAAIPLIKEYLRTLAGGQEEIDQLGLIEAKLEEIEAKTDAIKTAKSRGEIERLTLDLQKLNGELADLKALGDTKVTVNGKLVPVTTPKEFNDAFKLTPLYKEGVVVQAKLEFDIKGIDGSVLSAAGTVTNTLKTRSATDPLTKAIEDQLKNIKIPEGAIKTASGKYRDGLLTENERIGEEFANQWKDILGQGLGDTVGFFDSVLQAEADQYDQRLNQARAFYDEQTRLAGDNQRAKDEIAIRGAREEIKLRRQAFEADKEAKRASAFINGAAGVINAFATLPYPAAIVAAALIAAETATQIAIINQQRPRFKDGVINLQGPGTATSDSINARLSKGESVMTARETQNSSDVLWDIRNGKLNDRVYAKIVNKDVLNSLKVTPSGIVVQGMDDRAIISKLEELKGAFPSAGDIVSRNGMIYHANKKSETYKQMVRSKTI